ncbi:hypothetical protein Tco_0270537 [Tanacetum coccineum]
MTSLRSGCGVSRGACGMDAKARRENFWGVFDWGFSPPALGASKPDALAKIVGGRYYRGSLLKWKLMSFRGLEAIVKIYWDRTEGSHFVLGLDYFNVLSMLLAIISGEVGAGGLCWLRGERLIAFREVDTEQGVEVGNGGSRNSGGRLGLGRWCSMAVLWCSPQWFPSRARCVTGRLIELMGRAEGSDADRWAMKVKVAGGGAVEFNRGL